MTSPVPEIDLTRPSGQRLAAVHLDGPAGRLEALLNEGRSDAPACALVCHPHPLGGGTLHNKVVYHAMKALNSTEFGLGLPTLRFNFRGVGLSAGIHDGLAEVEDVEAALNWLRQTFQRPIVAVGFSFGADRLLAACSKPQADILALALLGLPIEAEGRRYHHAHLKDIRIPKLFLSGNQDAYAPATELADVVAQAALPRQLELIEGADHFFGGQLDELKQRLAGWIKEYLP